MLALSLCIVCWSLPFLLCLQMRLTLLVASTATAMITAAWKAWVAMATAAPTVAALVFLWTIPPTLMTSDTQPGDATLLTATPLYFLPPSLPPCPHLQWCSQPDFAVRWPDFFSWQICFGLHTYLHVLSWTGKSVTGNVDDETWMELELEDSQNKQKKQQKNCDQKGRN